MSRPLRVFLCHASQDKPAVWKLHRYLKQHGVQPWLDQEDLLPGQNWEVEIPKALFSSDVILVCISKNSVDKEGYVQKEISFALDKALEKPEGTIFVIPVKLEECDIPKRLGRYQWVDLSRVDGRKRLLLGLNKRAFDLGEEVSPVVLEDARQRKTAPKPAASDIVESEKAEQEVKAKAEGEAAEETAREQAEREEKERIVREAAEKAQRGKNAREFVERIKREQEAQSITFGEKPSRQPAPAQIADRQPTKPKMSMWVTVVLVLGLISLSVWGISQFNAPVTPTAFPTTEIPATEPPVATEAPTEAPTELPALGIGSTMVGEDGMVLMYVPAGDFLMGSSNADSQASSNEKPQHTVYLDAFWIDQTEVTNKMYSLCVSAGMCNEPSYKSSSTRSSYYGNAEFDDYPVLYVDWNMARTYCQWVGRDLPTEAQWEKAARGTDGRNYPWGEGIDATYANYNSAVGDTTLVGSYEKGGSVYGAYDMAGNVWEWTSDWYDVYPGGDPSVSSDFGQTYRVLRGGACFSGDSGVRSAYRNWDYPSSSNFYIGFRCARSP